ncbi:MAG: helix-turn-helix transcriptional regulator [Verrucomicrobiae bacterium]|nr:helix-turn-helix transcriptional regulator [Verrucomicrobiae bacterium]
MRNLKPLSRTLPVPERLFQEGIYATHAGCEVIEPHMPYPEPRAPIYFFNFEEGRILPEFCLSLCAEGRGSLETRQGIRRFDAGDAYLFLPGEWHRHRPDPETGWTNLWLHFNGDLPHEWMRDGAFKLSHNIAVIEDRVLFQMQFVRLLDSISQLPYMNSAAISWQAAGLLSHFVVDVSVARECPEGTARGIAWRAQDFIIDHTHTAISVADVARHIGCSRRTLETRFREATGRTVLEEIQHCRAARAKALLLETDMPIKQIVHRAGFQSSGHMRLVFKKLFGVGPGSVRKDKGNVMPSGPEA